MEVTMKLTYAALVLILIAAVLAGCGGEASSSAGEKEGTAAAPADTGTSAGGTLDESYDRALPVSNQLALGTFLLEKTENAVTPEQAAALLPLWQAIQSGALQSDAEIDAVLKQIEGTMSAEQVAAIAAMQLTNEDMGEWAREQGLNMGASPEAIATRQAAGGGSGPFGDMSEEEREAMRATAQAGGGRGNGQGGLGGFGDLSEEERESMRATAQAGGMDFGGRRFGAGQVTFLAEPLVELLTERAAE
jgi:hypothetical protein